jgi:hypothetical protein
MSGCADLVGLVSLQHVFALAIFVGKDGNGLGTQLGRRSEGADGDFTAVGYEYFAEHGASGGGWMSEVRSASA